MPSQRHPDKKICAAYIWGWEKCGVEMLAEEHNSNQSHILRAALLSFDKLNAQEQKSLINKVELEELEVSGNSFSTV